MNHATRRDGFTLIELLGVVVIILILAALLLPVVGRARESVNATKCLSNLKNLGVSMRLYSNDHDGLLPWSWDGTYTWSQALAAGDYSPRVSLSTYSFYHCPSWGAKPPDGHQPYIDTYGLTQDDEFAVTNHPAVDINNNQRLISMGSSTILLADSILDSGIRRENYYITRKRAGINKIHLQHQNKTKANAVFVDGHAAAVSAQEISDSGIIQSSSY